MSKFGAFLSIFIDIVQKTNKRYIAGELLLVDDKETLTLSVYEKEPIAYSTKELMKDIEDTGFSVMVVATVHLFVIFTTYWNKRQKNKLLSLHLSKAI